MAGKYPVDLTLLEEPTDTDVLVGGVAEGGAGSGRSFVQSAAADAHSVARRGAGATIKAADGVADDDLVTIKQLKSTANNAADATRKAESIAMSAFVFSTLFQE